MSIRQDGIQARAPSAAIRTFHRRSLMLLWAVSVGMLFRFQSPYRYHEAGIAYSWWSAAGVILLAATEAVGLYLYLGRPTLVTPARRLFRAAMFSLIVMVFSGIWTWFDCSTCMSNSLPVFPALGFVFLLASSLVLALYSMFQRRHLHAA